VLVGLEPGHPVVVWSVEQLARGEEGEVHELLQRCVLLAVSALGVERVAEQLHRRGFECGEGRCRSSSGQGLPVNVHTDI